MGKAESTDPTVARVDRERRALELKAASGDLLARIELLRRSHHGNMTNGTQCPACQMGARISFEALARDDRVARGGGDGFLIDYSYDPQMKPRPLSTTD